MTTNWRRTRISSLFAHRDIAEDFGPVADLTADERAWRREALVAAFTGYRDDRLMGVGGTWREALQDAAATGRIDLAEHDGDLEVAYDNLLHGAIWEFVKTPEGVAILDTCAA
ncbi:hypothetical protein ACIOEZ_32430 [Streptomyces sp. NPDC087866]|uniref:hypothetical protein n=1 Tax=Streptomyces sp. NPDC087866 TaxID=3365815 RepID=UPI003825694F